jgi:hypothetical protein
MTGPYFNLIEKYKTKMVDLDLETFDPANFKFDICQVKMDGWFVILLIENFHVKVITSGGEIRQEFDQTVVGNATLLAEWVHGTNWAKGSYLEDNFILHDVPELEFITNIHLFPYSERHEFVMALANSFHEAGILISAIANISIDEWREKWKYWVVEQKYEGFVFKNSKATFPMLMGKLKPEVDEDYIAMAFNEGQNRLTGTLGAIVGGLYRNGVLTKTCTVGGGFSDEQRDDIWANRDQLLGKVFRAYGKLKFSSGALRGPQFDDWRDDKDPLMCKAQP